MYSKPIPVYTNVDCNTKYASLIMTYIKKGGYFHLTCVSSDKVIIKLHVQ